MTSRRYFIVQAFRSGAALPSRPGAPPGAPGAGRSPTTLTEPSLALSTAGLSSADPRACSAVRLTVPAVDTVIRTFEFRTELGQGAGTTKSVCFTLPAAQSRGVLLL